jgi:RNA recognition motif-containing protein
MTNEKKRKLLRALKGDQEMPIEIFPDPPNTTFKLNDLQFVIENLPFEIDEDELKNHFEKFGEIADIEIDWKRRALITFLNFHQNPPGRFHRIHGILVFLGNHKSKKEPSSTVVITGGIDSVNGGKLRQYLNYFGKIVDFRRPVDRRTHRLSQMVFVKFDEAVSAQKLLRFKQHHLGDGQRKVSLEIFEFAEL